MLAQKLHCVSGSRCETCSIVRESVAGQVTIRFDDCHCELLRRAANFDDLGPVDAVFEAIAAWDELKPCPKAGRAMVNGPSWGRHSDGSDGPFVGR